MMKIELIEVVYTCDESHLGVFVSNQKWAYKKLRVTQSERQAIRSNVYMLKLEGYKKMYVKITSFKRRSTCGNRTYKVKSIQKRLKTKI